MINLFQPNLDDFQYILDSFGQWITVNNQPVQAVITNTPINQTSAAIDFDDKKIATLTPIKCGDNVHYNDEDWLIISEINGQRYGKYKGIMRVCDYPIKFNFEGIVKELPTIVDGRVFDTETGQFMTLPNSKILVTLQENQETLQIEVGQRFIKMGSAWQVEAIDRTQKGLLRLWCKQDQFNEAVDDIRNEIANAGSYVYALDIENMETTIQQGNTLQLNVSVTLNGTAVTDKTVVYSASDSNIAIVDANGLVAAINAGSVTITAQLADNPDVKDTISLTVEDLPRDNYALTINGDTFVTKGYSKTWTASLTNNGQPVTMKPATWSLTSTSGGTTNLATITSQSSESVTVKGNNLGYVKLICQLNDGSLSAEKQIQVKSLI
ncbi:Ig-like domain-containing protein [Brevibacillus sp. GCM10020057]|uniref:Ig-like domain-containing protein n=1 Tax=Brevibacillus sp. GCM10020057 TaxID=3317327 RepID=UPI003636C240